MSITTEIQRINGGKNAIRTLANQKNVNIPFTALIGSYASVLRDEWPDVTFGIRYDGAKIRGTTRNWNQLIKNGNFQSSQYWNASNATRTIQNGECTIVPSSEFGQIYQNQTGLIKSGHYYLIEIEAKYVSGAVGIGVSSSSILLMATNQLTSNYRIYRVITLATSDSDLPIIIYNSTSTNSFAVKSFMITDLTKSYGSGKEPTDVESPEALDIANYGRLRCYYDEGSLRYGFYKGTKLGEYDYIDTSSNLLHIGGEIVDLGTIDYNYDARGFFYSKGNFADATVISSGTIPNIVCLKYGKVVSVNILIASSVDCISYYTYQGTNYLHIRDSAFDDRIAFKQAMSGVKLYYELATPIEIPL